MATKLKNSINYEILFVFLCFLWTVLFTMTKNLFSSTEIFHDYKEYGSRLYNVIRWLTVGGAVCSLLFGIALIWFLWKVMIPVWRSREYSAIFLDKIPLETIVVGICYCCYVWGKVFISWELYWIIDEYYNWYDRQKYYLFHDSLLLLCSIALTSAALWLFLWQMMRRIVYHRCGETSFSFQIMKIDQFSSALGKKIGRRRNILIASYGISLFSGFAAIIMAFYGDHPNYLGIPVGIFVASQIFELAYLKFLDITSTEVNALIEQIRAISHAEDLNEKFRLTEKNLFYEPFKQLEEIDIAAKRSAEKQLQAERLKIDLITNVSHDLKTPLTSMVGYTDLLKQEELNAEARDYVDVIALKQEQLKEMIKQLFELSKVTSGAEQFKLETLDMRKLVEQIMGDMDDSIQKSGQTVRSNFEESPLLFTGDNEKMYRVVQNLLENALKYSLENTRIYITVKKEENRICLTMKNIASYEMDFMAEEITERFARGDKARTTEGHGLGLAIVSSYTQNMGGTFLVEVDGDLFKVSVEFPQVEGE